jgi:hypothetical protein
VCEIVPDRSILLTAFPRPARIEQQPQVEKYPQKNLPFDSFCHDAWMFFFLAG